MKKVKKAQIFYGLEWILYNKTYVQNKFFFYFILRMHGNGKIKSFIKFAYSKIFKTGAHTNPKYWI